MNFNELAGIIDSTCILAHVRAATQAFAVTTSNCHPFKFGTYSFMHNGDIADFQHIRRDLLSCLSDAHFNMIKGNSDSEHFFGLILEKLGQGSAEDPTQSMKYAIVQALNQLKEIRNQHQLTSHCDINAVLSDGKSGIIIRYSLNSDAAPSLFVNAGKRYVCRDGICRMEDPGHHVQSVIVSSEPLSEDPGWHEVPLNTMMVVRDGHILEDQVPLN